jgi:hypothetical protein
VLRPLEQCLPDIDFFVELCDGRADHKDEIMFWDQSQNQLHKIPKIPRLSQ